MAAASGLLRLSVGGGCTRAIGFLVRSIRHPSPPVMSKGVEPFSVGPSTHLPLEHTDAVVTVGNDLNGSHRHLPLLVEMERPTCTNLNRLSANVNSSLTMMLHSGRSPIV